MKLHAIGCPQCGEAIRDIELSQKVCAMCPRCDYHLATCIAHHPQKIIALSITGTMLFVFLLYFPFIAFSFQGLSHEIYLIDTVLQLIVYHHPLVALFLFVGVLFLPIAFLWGTIVLFSAIMFARLKPQHRRLCRGLFAAKEWLIADVFLVGVLVSLVKIGMLGHVTLHIGFYAFFLLIVCLVAICMMMDKGNTWQYFPFESEENVNGLCMVCHALGVKEQPCKRCHANIPAINIKVMLQRCWALLLTAFMLYIPANIWPMMVTVTHGTKEASTVLEGVSQLWAMHSYAIASLIFIASLVIPLAKMTILSTVFYQAGKKQIRPWRVIEKQNFWFRFTHLIGRWSFIDVFVVALLVALIQLKQVASVFPGHALVPFTAVVILTMISAQMFDTRVLWMHGRYSHDTDYSRAVCTP